MLIALNNFFTMPISHAFMTTTTTTKYCSVYIEELEDGEKNQRSDKLQELSTKIKLKAHARKIYVWCYWKAKIVGNAHDSKHRTYMNHVSVYAMQGRH